MRRRLDLFFLGGGWEGEVTSYTLGVRVKGIVERDGVVICIFFSSSRLKKVLGNHQQVSIVSVALHDHQMDNNQGRIYENFKER